MSKFVAMEPITNLSMYVFFKKQKTKGVFFVNELRFRTYAYSLELFWVDIIGGYN